MTRAPALALALLIVALYPANSPGSTPAGTPLDSISVEGKINALALAGDSLYLGGAFSSVTHWTGSMAKLDSAGDLATPMLPEVEGGRIRAIVSDNAGGWFIGGDFTSVGGHSVSRLAHVTAGGSVDTAFAPSPSAAIQSLEFDGTHVYAGGNFQSIGGQSTIRNLAKLNPADGSVVSAFDAPDQATVRALLHDGTSLYAGGSFVTAGPTFHELVKLDPTTGARDATFDPQASDDVTALARDATHLYVGGDFQIIGGQTNTDRLAKLNPSTGAVAAGWSGPNPNVSVNTLFHDGTNLWAGGGFTEIGSQTATDHLAKVNPATGVVDTTFDPNPNGTVLALHHDGANVYAAGEFTTIDGQTGTRYVAKVNPSNGAVDTGFNPVPDGIVRALGGGGSGTVIAAGSFHRAGPRANSYSNLVRLDLATGNVDPAFDPIPNGAVSTLVHQAGRLYVGGEFTTIDGQAATPRLAAVDPLTGTVDAGFDPAPNSAVQTLSHDGASLFAGGEFSQIDGQGGTPHLAKMNPSTGAVDTTFDPAPDGRVLSLWHTGTVLYAGGTFATIDNETSVDNLAKLDPATGAADLNFNPDPSNGVGVAVVRALWHDGTNLFAGGTFTEIDNQFGTPHLAKIHPTLGAVDITFNPAPSNSSGATKVNALWHDGTSLYAGGVFNNVGGQSAPANLVKLSPSTGAVDSGFDPGPTSDDLSVTVNGVNIDTDTDVMALIRSSTTLFAAGRFDYAATVEHEGFAIFGPPRPANTGLPAITGTAVPGGTLTCSDGSWTDATLPFSRRWLADGTAIAGQTAATYLVATADLGKAVTCEVTARNGTGPSAPATSAPVTVASPATGGDPGTTDPGTGGTTDPGTGGTTDPGTGGTTDPGTGSTTDPGTGSTDGTGSETQTLDAATTLKKATLKCRRATRNGRKILRCRLTLPANGSPAKTIRATARSRRGAVVARRKLRVRSGTARFELPRSARKLILRYGGAKVTRRIRPR